MTYDTREQLAAFHAEHALPYPLLQDIDIRHVNAFGILNDDYAPGDSGYGVPHPGIIVTDQAGIVIGTLAYPGFKERPSFEAVLGALRDVR